MDKKETAGTHDRLFGMNSRQRPAGRPSRHLFAFAILTVPFASFPQFFLHAGQTAVLSSEHPTAWRPAPDRRSSMAFQLTTAAFPAGGTIPKQYTCDGPDVSPELSWTDAPAGTKSLALIVDDPDAPGRVWVHWVLFNLPAGTHKLAEGVGKDPELADGSRQGRNDFGKIGYNGPCPPRGPAHRYYFKLYALDSKLDLKAGSTKADLERATKDHVLAHAELVGKFGH
jgi:Raf kinase inhibitor-like YbhB/YbcL family protein